MPKAQKYTFEPYDYGAISFEIYSDLDILVSESSPQRIPVESQSWPLYALTQKGDERADGMRKVAPTAAVRKLHQVKEFVFAYGFFDMLRQVYKKYPKYAERSVLNLRN